MPRRIKRLRARPKGRPVLMIVAGLAGAAAALIAGIASASSFTLRVEKNVHVTNTPTKAFRVEAVDTREAVAVGPSGYPIYTFQGETTHHLICHKTSNASTNCWAFWPPVSPASGKAISKQSAIKGKLASFRNHGTLQVTLNGQPLYYFTPDIMSKNKHQALGDELKTFGSIWHVVAADQGVAQAPASPQPTTPTSTTPYMY